MTENIILIIFMLIVVPVLVGLAKYYNHKACEKEMLLLENEIEDETIMREYEHKLYMGVDVFETKFENCEAEITISYDNENELFTLGVAIRPNTLKEIKDFDEALEYGKKVVENYIRSSKCTMSK